MKNAILVVSFGTSYEETRKKTIDQIERSIQEHYPQSRVYRAWTSGMIRKKVRERDGLRIFDVKEAMAQMADDGIETVVVQPTHVLNGLENDWMIRDVTEWKGRFRKVTVADPLLTSQEDFARMVHIIAQEYHPTENEALVLMGHGTSHFANAAYAALDYQFKDMGFPNIHVGTVEGYPELESVLKAVEKQKPQKIILAPLMIVAGDHAVNDLAGDEEDSWKNRFRQAGYEVECVLRGLGESEKVREIFVKHVAKAGVSI